MKTTKVICGTIAGLWLLLPAVANGQRVRVPTPVTDASNSSAGTAASGTPQVQLTSQPALLAQTPGAVSPYGTGVYGSGGTNVYGAAPGSPYATPPAGAVPLGTLPPPGAAAGTYVPPSGTTGVSPFAPSAGPAYSVGPGATGAPAPLGGYPANAPPGAAWDPYAIPGAQPPTLLPQDPCLPSSPQICAPGGFASMQKFIQEVRADNVWMPLTGNNGLGVDDLDLSVTFAVPAFFNIQQPFLVTPGFTFHFWDGPVTAGNVPGALPPVTYDGYLDVAWNPQFSPIFCAELGARVGVYSDFSTVTKDSIRFTGHALGALSLSPRVQLKAGIVYIDRVHYKLLPAGGIVWTPNPDVRFELLFPNPRISRRIATYGNTDWWLYLRGEYGGGAWTVKQYLTPIGPTYLDEFEYDDIRVGLGLEFDTPGSWKGLVEVGCAFERQLLFRSGIPATRYPDPTIYVRGVLAF